MFRYYKDEQKMSLNRGETASFNIIVPVKDENGYIKYSDGTNDYWYDRKKKKVYDSNYKKTKIDVNTLKIQLRAFSEDDVIRFKVFRSGDVEDVKIQKDFKTIDGATSMPINLTSYDTSFGAYINEPVDYWYEVELNPDTNPRTIIGYDDDKQPKIFRLRPEGGDKE